ncbi:MAG TPA: hypothetical protein DGJ56_05155 [Verrucomicrobiales bacterium]|nr:hypothetical protein [Verrucomicrobiales bacterium]
MVFNGIGRFFALGKALGRVDFDIFLYRLAKRLARRRKNSRFSGVFGLKKKFSNSRKRGCTLDFFCYFARPFSQRKGIR